MTSHVKILKNLKWFVAGAAPQIEIQTAFCYAEIQVSRAILFCVIIIKVGDAENTKPNFTSLIN